MGRIKVFLLTFLYKILVYLFDSAFVISFQFFKLWYDKLILRLMCYTNKVLLNLSQNIFPVVVRFKGNGSLSSNAWKMMTWGQHCKHFLLNVTVHHKLLLSFLKKKMGHPRPLFLFFLSFQYIWQ